MGGWSGKTLDSDNPGLHPALCDLRKGHSCFLHPHQQVGEDLEVCTEGPDQQEHRPLSEDSQVSNQAGSSRGGAEAMETQRRRRRKAKEPKAPRNQKGEDRASCLSEGD